MAQVFFVIFAAMQLVRKAMVWLSPTARRRVSPGKGDLSGGLVLSNYARGRLTLHWAMIGYDLARFTMLEAAIAGASTVDSNHIAGAQSDDRC